MIPCTIRITNKNKISEMIWIKEKLLARYGYYGGLRALKAIADSIKVEQETPVQVTKIVIEKH